MTDFLVALGLVLVIEGLLFAAFPGMAKAAMVAGADGIMVEVHPDPAEAKSDGSQTLDQAQFEGLMADLRRLSDYAGVTL